MLMLSHQNATDFVNDFENYKQLMELLGYDLGTKLDMEVVSKLLSKKNDDSLNVVMNNNFSRENNLNFGK